MPRVGMLLVFCVMLSGVSLSHGLSLGRCPEVSVQNNFQANLYAGKWYEYARSFLLSELGAKCVVSDYVIYGNGNNSLAVRKQFDNFFSKVGLPAESSAVLTSTSGDGHLDVSHASSLFSSPYWVLGTDYKNYSVVWSCNNYGFLSSRKVWILTRVRFPSPEVLQTAFSVLDANNIRRWSVSVTDQNECSY